MEKKAEKIILIKTEPKLHDDYRAFCKRMGYNMSQRIRNFIDQELKSEKV